MKVFFKLGIALLIAFFYTVWTPLQVAAVSFSDTFTRTQANGWGSSDSGSSYTLGGGNSSEYAVNGSKGSIVQGTTATNRTLRLLTVNEADVDMKIKISLDKKPLTNTQHLYLIARRNSTSNSEYFGHVLWLTNNKVYVNIQVNNAGTFTDLTANTAIPEMAQEINKEFWVRFQVSGTNPTTLKIKAWYDGWKEPTYWTSTVTDSTANIQQAGTLGVRAYLSSAVSNAPITVSFDNFTITNPTPAPTPPALTGSASTKGTAWHIGEWYNTANAPNTYYFGGIYADLDRMKAAGIKWVRFTIDQGTQTTCGDNTKFYSRIRDALKARGMEGLARVSIPNSLTTTASSGERASFVSWITTLVDCYKNDFTYWELGNENNLAAFWNINDADGSDPVAYAQSVNWYYLYLNDFYTAVKNIDSDLQVVHGGLSQHHLDRWLTEMASINPSSYFDIMAFHPYSDLGADGTINQLNILYAKMQTIPGMETKPIWITEVGYTADAAEYPGNTGGSESTKASYLSDAYQKLLDWGVSGPIFWYDFAQNSTSGTSKYELTFTDRSTVTYTDRLAYTAMQNLWPGGITAPSTAISSVVAQPSTTSATISWTTSYIRSSQVEYGLTTSYGTNTSVSNTSPMTTAHSVSLPGLLPCVRYHYRVKSADTLGAVTTGSDGTFTTQGCTGSATIRDTAEASIPSATGGSTSLLQSGKGIQVSAPAGFTGSDAVVQIKSVEPRATLGTTQTPQNRHLVGDYLYDLKALTGVGTAVTTFAQNLSITLTYSDESVVGQDENSLRIHRWDGSSWYELSNCSVDTSTNTVTCSTGGFSIFGLFGNLISSGSGSSQSSQSSTECRESVGNQAPWLYGAVPRDESSIVVYFTKASDPVDRYALLYGPSEDKERYGAPELALPLSSQMSYAVTNLQANTTYFFKVRGGNGCKPGSWSNELSAKTLSAHSQPRLELVSSKLLDENSEEKTSVPITQEEAQKDDTHHRVEIKVIDPEGLPLEGAKVTLHSKVQEGETNADGRVVFENVEAGAHTVHIAYQNFEGEQALYLTEDKTTFSLEITVTQRSVFWSPVYLISMGSALFICIVLIVLILRLRSRRK